MLKIIMIALIFVPVCHAETKQETKNPSQFEELYTVKKDKDGKPLPVCAIDQTSTKEKPCRLMTNSQRVGAASR